MEITDWSFTPHSISREAEEWDQKFSGDFSVFFSRLSSMTSYGTMPYAPSSKRQNWWERIFIEQKRLIHTLSQKILIANETSH